VEQKNSPTFKIDKKHHKDILDFIKLNELGDVDVFINKCFKNGFNIEKYGLIGNDVEIKEIEKIVEVPVEKIVEIIKEVPVPPVEIEVIKYVDREVIKEVPVEKVVSNIDNISDKYDEKIFHLNEELEQERRKFSIKLTDLENIFHKEKNELLSQIDKLNEDKTNDKSKMLENTLLNLRKELHLKQTKINELEDKIKQLEEQLSKNVNAFYLKGSNLNQRI
jgi:uncharacterized protein with von Willebrand factor type A (vWA) domain